MPEVPPKVDSKASTEPSSDSQEAADNEALGKKIDSRVAGVVTTILEPKTKRGETLIFSLLLPTASVLIALAICAVLLTVQGVPALEAYQRAAQGAFGSQRGLVNTATAATPLILIGLGVALAYRAKLITIGAEGQFLVGALAGTGFVTWPGVAGSLPGPVLLVLGLFFACLAGGFWSALTGWLHIRFDASVVITTLLLNYVAQALLAYATRVGLRDPDAYQPQTRAVGDAALPSLPGLTLHAGFALAVVLVIVMWVAQNRGRLGLRVDVMGASRGVLRATEVGGGRFVIVVLGIAGVLAGLAGFVEVAGVTTRVTGAFSGAVGFTAIMTALLGRLHPAGVFVASILMAGLNVGFASASRSLAIPSTTVQIIQALIVLLFVAGGALLSRRGSR